jgi:hypothetical protein
VYFENQIEEQDENSANNCSILKMKPAASPKATKGCGIEQYQIQETGRGETIYRFLFCPVHGEVFKIS